MYRSRSARSASFHDPGTRFAESERIEGAGSWDALEWTKIEVIHFRDWQPISRSVSQGIKKFLLPAEQVIVEVCSYHFLFFQMELSLENGINMVWCSISLLR
nr:phosphatidylinositol-3-phosphatase myotubularin-1 isoform X1 [Ipomoea batatas]